MAILNDHVRLDGRKMDEVRPIWTEVDYLPSTHGSAIFNRGETQALTTLTLGTKLDGQLIDNALDYHDERFILHYNFPGYSVGEVKPQRGPGRREVGHANLAARSLRFLLPQTPYTIRIVSDILESNGSSSMATVCAGSLALMDAGIQIPGHVAGIAMGMIAEEGKIAILSDILGDEDALGDMDFKVTGTVNGICGCQMDIKIDGLPYEQLEQALEQARKGRLHIIGEMDKTINQSNEELKPHAPRMVVIVIDKEFIGAVIGPGGKVVQEMQRTTGATITIEEREGKGYVSVFATDKEALEKAQSMVQAIIYEPQVGDVHTGKVATVMPYGVFVDFKGNKSGLLHVSEMSWSRIDNVEEAFTEGDEITFKIIEIDKKTGKARLSRKAILPSPDGKPYVMTESSNSGGGGGRDDRRGGGGGRDDRRGGGGDRRDDRRPPPRR
jgi:polyribonucleotide nucleotidyltransferase